MPPSGLRTLRRRIGLGTESASAELFDTCVPKAEPFRPSCGSRPGHGSELPRLAIHHVLPGLGFLAGSRARFSVSACRGVKFYFQSMATTGIVVGSPLSPSTTEA